MEGFLCCRCDLADQDLRCKCDMLPSRADLIFVFVVMSCGGKKEEPRGGEQRVLAHQQKGAQILGNQEPGVESLQDLEPNEALGDKKVHDVFPMGPYRVDLISRNGSCFAEVYASIDPSFGASLKIPLELKAPCFVRRRVLGFTGKKTAKTGPGSFALGGPYVYRHKRGATQALVTVLIGEPIVPNSIDSLVQQASLRCGQKWLYLSEQQGVFSVSTPKNSDHGVCALKSYLNPVRSWGFNREYDGDKPFPLPPKVKGNIILAPDD